jgi:hypothetical protein
MIRLFTTLADAARHHHIPNEHLKIYLHADRGSRNAPWRKQPLATLTPGPLQAA